MSILETPRIYFSGEIAWDPVTTNNYQANYNEGKCVTVFTRGEDVAAFRQSAIDQVTSDGNWNPDGTYRSTYFNTVISGVDTGTGLSKADPFVNAPVSFTGMLIDSEPYGSYSSQLFFDDMSFGINGGCRIYGKRVTRFNDRYINFQRNPHNNMIAGVAGVMWQTCFPKNQGLVIDAHDSPALQALAAAIADDDVLGVMVRWDSYRTVYYDDPTLANGTPATLNAGKALQDKLDGGGFQPNPARSLLVGSVGLWRRGDPIHEAGDRALLATGVPVGPSFAGLPPAVGSAHARVSGNKITLDLSNCIPDADRTPEKVNLGDLALTATDPAPAVATLDIATIPFDQYNQAAYEATSGIVEIPIPDGMAATLENMDLKLSGADGTVYLVEEALRALPSDPNLYMNQGDTVSTVVQVYDRGAAAGSGIKVTMASIDNNPLTRLEVSETTDANGIAQFLLEGTGGTVTGYALLIGDNPKLPVTPSNFNSQTQTYMYVRVLPADDIIAALEPTWQNVLDNVLGNWQAMAPCMDNWLDLGNEDQVKAYAAIIKKLTDPANFESYRYMPITRDLTTGQRTLLYNFLDGTSVTADLFAAKADDEAPDTERPNYAELSGAMRKPAESDEPE